MKHDPMLLISRHLHGVATTDEREALVAWLHESPDHVRRFACESFVHRRMVDVVAGEAEWAARLRSAASDNAQPLQRISWLLRPVSFLAAAVLMIGLLVSWSSWRDGPFGDSAAVWIEAKVDAPEGWNESHAVMGPNAHHLESGWVSVRYASGAHAMIQGPATFRVEDEASLSLTRGQAVIHCPTPASHGFRIHLPNARITDLGTEFGVRVLDDGASETHVFEGTIELAADHANPVSLQAGLAMRVSANGRVLEPMETDSRGFLRTDAFESMVRAQKSGRDEAWASYVTRLRHDKALIYWSDLNPGSGPAPSMGFAPNQAGAVETMMSSLRFASGRFSGDRAVEIQRGGAGPRIEAPDVLENLTLAAWVWFNSEDDTAPRHRGLLMSDGWNVPGQVHWQRKGRDFRLSIYVPGQTDGTRFATSADSLRDGRWVLLASVIDRDAGAVSHYVDGTLVARQAVSQPLPPLRLGRCTLGGWRSGIEAGTEEDRSLNGRMDEFYIWARALTEAEVEELHRNTAY